MEHVSVMLQAAVDGLNIIPDGIYVDGTLGRGGHSCAILSQLTTGHLYAFDLDPAALAESEPRLAAISSNYTLFHANFKDIASVLAGVGVTKINGLLLDLGVSSPQFDDASRGFSYRMDSRLDMRMDSTQALDAYQIVNQWSLEELITIFRQYGQEPYAVPISRQIVNQRQKAPVETTEQLVEIIKQALPAKVLAKKGHPAKQVFQALRMAVNDEQNNLKQVLTSGLELLAPLGRFAVISFQSLEDKMVKTVFRSASQPPYIDPKIPLKENEIPQPDFRLITPKAVMASELEVEQNHRSHSARLRIIERRA